jgi:hypothetical protein
MKNKNLLTVLFLIFCVLTSCVYNRSPSKSEFLDITEGQKSLVLLRVTCDYAGESPVESSSGCIAGETIAMGDFDTGGELEQIDFLKSFSPETSKQGWAYWVLEPGIYYIGFQALRTSDVFTHIKKWRYVQPFRFDIQTDSSVVYIGTMHLQCSSTWNLLGAKNCTSILSQVVRNEEALAQKLVSENLKAMGNPTTVLMQRHTEKTYIFRTPKSKK